MNEPLSQNRTLTGQVVFNMEKCSKRTHQTHQCHHNNKGDQVFAFEAVISAHCCCNQDSEGPYQGWQPQPGISEIGTGMVQNAAEHGGQYKKGSHKEVGPGFRERHFDPGFTDQVHVTAVERIFLPGSTETQNTDQGKSNWPKQGWAIYQEKSRDL